MSSEGTQETNAPENKVEETSTETQKPEGNDGGGAETTAPEGQDNAVSASGEDTASEVTAAEGAEEEVADGGDDTAYAYVRNGDTLEKGAVIRIDESKLHLYLLDPIRIPTFDENGVREGEVKVNADWPFTLKIDDKSAEAVRLYRASAESAGFAFQFTEVSQSDWEESQK